MRKKFLNISMNAIKKKYPDYSDEKLAEIEYGLEALYITFTKTIVITLISILLGVIKEVFFVLLFYNILRTTAFGMHAKTSIQCYILSSIFFIGAGIICKYVEIIFFVKIAIAFICLINVIVFAPADTYKRPLINKKKRKMYKLFSIVTSLVYIAIIIYFHNYSITNCILFGLVDSALMIHPLMYRMFQLPYNNYKSYTDIAC